MNKIAMFLCALTFAPCAALAYTQDETNRMVMAMITAIRSEWPDVVYANKPNPPPKIPHPWFPTYESLFAWPLSTNELWTAQARRDAFESFVDRIPELSTNGEYRLVEAHSENALGFCLKHGQTNAIAAAMRILASPHSCGKTAALDVFEAFARPSEEMNRFAESVLTNSPGTALTLDQSYFLSTYGYMLLQHHGETDGAAFTNGVRLVRRSIDGKDGWMMLDMILEGTVPDYSASSNRLALALNALNISPRSGAYGEVVNEDTNQYFTPITNSLLNATQPLNILDLSWMERGTSAAPE